MLAPFVVVRFAITGMDRAGGFLACLYSTNLYRTNIRSIHQTRKSATMAPAMWTIQSPAVCGFPKLNIRQ